MTYEEFLRVRKLGYLTGYKMIFERVPGSGRTTKRVSYVTVEPVGDVLTKESIAKLKASVLDMASNIRCSLEELHPEIESRRIGLDFGEAIVEVYRPDEQRFRESLDDEKVPGRSQ